MDGNGVPYDLADNVSLELAKHLNSTGRGWNACSDELIDKSLPSRWRFERDKSGKGRHSYLDTMTGVYQTVHPARFFVEDDPTPIGLPPGWKRRIDAWGSLFFVDDNTESATREDPRFNLDVDEDTGLPQGWHRISDHRGKRFLLRGRGNDHYWFLRRACYEKQVYGQETLSGQHT